MSEVGYKKPPEHTQFGQPGGNIPGKTSEQRKLEIANAEAATRLRSRMLRGLEAKLEEAEDAGDSEAVAMIEANILKLLKDSEDRGLGTPVQSVNVESPNGTMSPPTTVQFVGVDADGED